MENSVAALTLIGLVARAPVIIKYRPAVCAMEPQGLNRLMREHNTNRCGQGEEVSVAKNKPLPGWGARGKRLIMLISWRLEGGK